MLELHAMYLVLEGSESHSSTESVMKVKEQMSNVDARDRRVHLASTRRAWRLDKRRSKKEERRPTRNRGH